MNSKQLAWKIRRHGIEMTHLSGGSHIGAILSVADIIAVLYADVIKFDPNLNVQTRPVQTGIAVILFVGVLTSLVGAFLIFGKYRLKKNHFNN